MERKELEERVESAWAAKGMLSPKRFCAKKGCPEAYDTYLRLVELQCKYDPQHFTFENETFLSIICKNGREYLRKVKEYSKI